MRLSTIATARRKNGRNAMGWLDNSVAKARFGLNE